MNDLNARQTWLEKEKIEAQKVILEQERVFGPDICEMARQWMADCRMT